MKRSQWLSVAGVVAVVLIALGAAWVLWMMSRVF